MFDPLIDSMPIPFSGCWIAEGNLCPSGYVSIGSAYAHRIAWTKSFGKIPHRAIVHHRCGVKSCCNPNHLELLASQADHAREHGFQRPKVTHCVHGHEYTPSNTHVNRQGYRVCRQCEYERSNRRGRYW